MAVNKVCCTCLSFDVEMLSLTDDEIRKCFEKAITNIEMELENEFLQNVCAECVLVMRKFVTFKARCLEANQRLREILAQSTCISKALLESESRKLYSEKVSFDNTPIISDPKLLQVKLQTFSDEIKTNYDLEDLPKRCESLIDSKIHNVKVQHSSPCVRTDQYNSETDDVSSGNPEWIECNDVEDTTSQMGSEKKERSRSARKKKLRRNSAFWKSDFAVQIILTEEQQMEEFFKKEISEIYLKADFKCFDCFTGFTSKEKYEKHMDLHDERHGAYQCVICKLRFGNSVRLRLHEAAHENRYKCISCGKLTKSRTQAKRHNNRHLHTVPYECKLCDTKFQQEVLYRRHSRTAHPTDHVCVLCGDYFTSQLHLDKHRRIKIDCTKFPKNIVNCKMCDRPFLKLGNSWYIHMLGHSKEKEQTPPTECQICGRVTTSWNDWSHHFCSEHRNKNVDKAKTVPKKPTIKFICDVCGKALSAKCKLVQHIHTQHTDGTPYNKFVWQDTCEICNKRILRTNMKRHLSTHTGEKPYKCDVCGKFFTQAYTRDDHARTIHKRMDGHPVVKRRKKISPEQSLDANGKPLNFPCLICPKRFNGRQHLIMHERSHTGEKPFSCDVCKRSYVSKHTLEVHRMIHTGEKPYSCEMCDQKFTYKSSLQNHIKDHTGETPYACDICDRRFKSKNNLKRHELVHTGVKNHACDLCGKTFIHHGSLKLHVKTIHLNLPHPPRKPRHRKI